MTMNISIIGDSDTGKTTFLVLLYAAQIRYSEFSEGVFRFYINPKSIDHISTEYNMMHMGNWPSDKLINENHQISFLYGRTKNTTVGKFFKFLGGRDEADTVSMNFCIYALSDPELANVINSTKMSFFNISPKVENLLNSKIIVIVIDSSKLKKKKHEEVDQWISNALVNISRFNRKKIYPIIIFSKFELIHNKLLINLRLPKTPPDEKKSIQRIAMGERLMSNFYSGTLNLIQKNKLMNYGNIMYFFPRIKTVRKQDGTSVPALKRTVESGFVLDCEYSEFIYFIKHLEKISRIIENN